MTNQLDITLTSDEEEDVSERARQACAWLQSDAGHEAVRETSRKTSEAARSRAEAQVVDLRELDRPITF